MPPDWKQKAMIAKANATLSRSSRPRLDSSGGANEMTLDADEQTRIWNCLFQGSLTIQQVRLRFHDCTDIDVIAVIALDFRPNGWVVTGMRIESQQPIEHQLDRIRDAEILGEETTVDEIGADLPPMA
jgi:hypothetical protein